MVNPLKCCHIYILFYVFIFSVLPENEWGDVLDRYFVVNATSFSVLVAILSSVYAQECRLELNVWDSYEFLLLKMLIKENCTRQMQNAAFSPFIPVLLSSDSNKDNYLDAFISSSNK